MRRQRLMLKVDSIIPVFVLGSHHKCGIIKQLSLHWRNNQSDKWFYKPPQIIKPIGSFKKL